MRALFWVLTVLLAYVAAAQEKKIVCYFGSWAVYRQGNGQFDISDIDANLCTHLVYTFVGLGDSGSINILDPWADLPDGGGRDGFNRFNRLRAENNPFAKTLIAIGGWNEGSVKYSKLAADPELRKTFALNAVKFVKKYGFDGLDLDWEYPAQRGGSAADKENFVLLLKEMRQVFDKAGLLLTAALGAAPLSASKSYIIPEVIKYLDLANLMAYDMHVGTEDVTGNHAPLHAGSWEQGNDLLLNVDASIRYWLSQGVSPEKLTLGVPFYGRSFTLENEKNNGIGAPAVGPGEAGPYTKEPGSVGYNEICEKQLNERWEVHYNEEQQVPYATSGSFWVSYENARSIKEKAEYINKLGLAGAMVWSIETDDFKGICGEKNPLLRSLNEILRP